MGVQNTVVQPYATVLQAQPPAGASHSIGLYSFVDPVSTVISIWVYESIGNRTRHMPKTHPRPHPAMSGSQLASIPRIHRLRRADRWVFIITIYVARSPCHPRRLYTVAFLQFEVPNTRP